MMAPFLSRAKSTQHPSSYVIGGPLFVTAALLKSASSLSFYGNNRESRSISVRCCALQGVLVHGTG
jgi:hypothetical protein